VSEIILKDVTVEYLIYGADSRSIKKSLLHATIGGRLSSKKAIPSITAINKLSLHIKHGDRVGLVGHNGSGKSTLLRVIAGILEPTHGELFVDGRISTLFDINLGMDDHLTGYENIMVRGLLLGHSRNKILLNLDEISDFTGLGEFLNMPLHTYSDGMKLRLAFSVSTAFKPDILLMDEGILAGDADFVDKAVKRLKKLVDGSSIMILATHSEELLSKFCTKRVDLGLNAK